MAKKKEVYHVKPLTEGAIRESYGEMEFQVS